MTSPQPDRAERKARFRENIRAAKARFAALPEERRAALLRELEMPDIEYRYTDSQCSCRHFRENGI